MSVKEFLEQFKDDKRSSVTQFLLIIGMDMAKKLGQNNPKDLYHTLKQLASRNIELDYKQSSSGDLRSEIKKIQQQLVQLNQHFNYKKSLNSRFQTQYDGYPDTQFQSPEAARLQSQKTSKRSQRHKSPIYQSNVTGKITESPPPPIVYIQNVNTKILKPHLDDHQIKQLLYEREEFDSLSQRNNSPKSYKYTLNLQSSQLPDSQRDQPETQKKKKRVESKSKGKKTLPSYLQNVESKIKTFLEQDKQAHKQQKKPVDQEKFESFNNQKTANFQPKRANNISSGETDTYYDIQQYLMSQKNHNFDYSPVQEMKTDNVQNSNNNQKSQCQEYTQKQSLSSKKNDYIKRQHFYDPQMNVSDFQYSKKEQDKEKEKYPHLSSIQHNHSSQRNFKQDSTPQQEDESSESFSNFTPPNKEVREFFQKQFAYKD
ncbi:hypothetical protein pb186bvf_019311 [Paramecium bursaria]